MKIQQLSALQAQKETLVNENFEAVNIAADFSRDKTTSGGLTWGYFGGTILLNGVLTVVASGTIALTASSTNYVEMTFAGVVSKNTTGFTAGRIPLYTVVTDASQATTITDKRTIIKPYGYLSKALTDANYTLTEAESKVDFINFTGTLTAARTITLPAVPDAITIKNTTTGGFALTISAGGTTASVANATIKNVVCDGSACFVV
jgi:hypothetical protein